METRVRIAASLVEGNSIRATARLTHVDKNSVMSHALRLGEGCLFLHDQLVRKLPSYIVQVDETWSFIHTKEARVDRSKAPPEYGDCYAFIGLCSSSKLVISYFVGKRDEASTKTFVADLRARLTVVPHITTDGFTPYLTAIAQSFPGCADFGQVVKNYRTGARRGPDHRYEPPRDPFITKTPVMGVPDERLMSTSHVERFSLTLRHTVGRTRRLCLAFSRTLRGHRAAVALAIAAYNFCKVHSTHWMTPAMAAGLADEPWTIERLVTEALAAEPVPAPKPQPLVLPPERDAGTARELPNGRGFLRVVKGGSGDSTLAAPPPPRRRGPVQLSLFDPDDV